MNTEFEQYRENIIDWNTEATKLTANEKKDWWSPKEAGKYKVKILNNGDKYTTEWEGKTIPKVRFDINVGDSTDILSWGIAEGKTTESLFGMLALLGKHKGTLKDQTITLVVKKTHDAKGKEKKVYTVLEALELMA